MEGTNFSAEDMVPEITAVKPTTLPEIAEELLTSLAKQPLSTEIVLGGGIALKHYADFRPTQDIDAWWRMDFNPEAVGQFAIAVQDVGERHGFTLLHRRFGVTDSLELRSDESGQTEFSFQIVVRDVHLDEPRESPWHPLLIETLRENIGSKMNALVNRGAPRDFIDIFEIVNRKFLTVQACWNLWRAKNPNGNISQAQADVVTSLLRIEQRRPLDQMPQSERIQAMLVRDWFKSEFAVSLDIAE